MLLVSASLSDLFFGVLGSPASFWLVGVFLFLVVSLCTFFLVYLWLFLYRGLASSLPVSPVLALPLGLGRALFCLGRISGSLRDRVLP